MRVRTTPQFEHALDRLMNCGNDIYSRSTVKSVYAAYKHYRQLLSEQPYIGSEEPILNDMPIKFRHIVIKPQFKFIYAIIDDEVYMIDLWDTRQSLERLRNRID